MVRSQLHERLAETYLEVFVRWLQICVVGLLSGSLEGKSHVLYVGTLRDFRGEVPKEHKGGIGAIHIVKEIII